MLMRLMVFAGGIALVALTLPGLATNYLNRPPAQSAPLQKPPGSVATPAAYTGTRGVVLQPASNGHFVGSFSINGRKESGMVDTGASMIAINVSAARRFGLSPANLDFSATVGTANGVVKAAPVMLDRVEIGTISVRDIQAVVLPDKALSGMLIGMTFLDKLSSYRVEDGALHLFK